MNVLQELKLTDRVKYGHFEVLEHLTHCRHYILM